MEQTLPERSEDGVDLTLIRWFLTLTPAERLDALDSWINSIHEIRSFNGEPAADSSGITPPRG